MSFGISARQLAQSNQPSSSVPNFTGLWELNKSKSKLTKENPVNNGGTVTISITHSDPELRIVQKTVWKGKESQRESIYYTDGRGESNKTSNLYLSFYNGNETGSPTPRATQSISTWKDKKVKTTYSFMVQLPDGRQLKMNAAEEWQLSSDGQTLQQTTSFSSDDDRFDISFQPHKIKKVFDKRLPVSGTVQSFFD
jgi:hypothetical protein